jgi:UDP-N-acetyl-D-glucosamine dehydrogenase
VCTALSNLLPNNPKIGILGLGYVGLPLSLLFSNRYNVHGYDPSDDTINKIISDDNIVNGVKRSIIKKNLNVSFFPSANIDSLKDCDVYIICVPTPLKGNKKPDLKYIKNAALSIVPYIKPNKLVVLESTTYPGTTEGLLSSILERSGLNAGLDFYLAFSPERIDPGNEMNLKAIPKIVGGVNEISTILCTQLYAAIFDTVVPVANSKTAEATKLFENIFRLVNIALVNEVSLIFDELNINTWDVISAASTKPYGFMPFYPGPGVGGHCIPLDPFYLTYRSEQLGISSRFINLSAQINEFMTTYVINIIISSLSKFDLNINDSKIAIFGMTYKKDLADVRESPSIYIVEELDEMEVDFILHDPFVDSLMINGKMIHCNDCLEDVINEVDCAVFLVDHTEYLSIDPNKLVDHMNHNIIIDCKNLFQNENSNIHLVGIGKNIS